MATRGTLSGSEGKTEAGGQKPDSFTRAAGLSGTGLSRFLFYRARLAGVPVCPELVIGPQSMIRPAGEREKEKVQKSGQNRVGVWSNDDRAGRGAGPAGAFPLTWGNFFCNRAGCSIDALSLYRLFGPVEPARISGTGTVRPTRDSPVPAALPGTFFPGRNIVASPMRGNGVGTAGGILAGFSADACRSGLSAPPPGGCLCTGHAWLRTIGGRSSRRNPEGGCPCCTALRCNTS